MLLLLTLLLKVSGLLPLVLLLSQHQLPSTCLAWWQCGRYVKLSLLHTWWCCCCHCCQALGSISSQGCTGPLLVHCPS